MKISPQTFARAMVILFGENWVGPASDRYGTATKKLKRMATGAEDVGTTGLWTEIEQDLRDMGSRIDAVLLEVIDYKPEA